MVHRTEHMRPSRSRACVLVTRVVAAVTVSPGASVIMSMGMSMPVPVPRCCVLLAGLWLAIHSMPRRAACDRQCA